MSDRQRRRRRRQARAAAAAALTGGEGVESISYRQRSDDEGIRFGKPHGITFSHVAIVAAWLVSAMVTYAAASARFAVLESEVQRMKLDVTEIRGDVKSILRGTWGGKP